MPIPRPYRFANFIDTELLADLSAVDTVLSIPVDMALQLPTLTAPEQIILALWDGQQAPELVAVTDNPQTGLLTVERAQEGTSALAWGAGTQVKCVLSAGIIDSALQAYFNLPSQLEGFFLPIQGGEMLGPLFLNPSSNPAVNEAVPRSYVDAIGAGFMRADGSIVMTGNLQMGGHVISGLDLTDPSSNDYATSKKYVDAKFAAANSGSSALIQDDSSGIVTTGSEVAYIANVANNKGPLTANWDFTTITIRPHVRNLANATIKLQFGNADITAFPGFKPILQGGDNTKPISQRIMQANVPYRMTYLPAPVSGWVVHGLFLPTVEVTTGKIEWEMVPANTVKVGYVRLIGETIGSTGASAYTGADCQELYLYNWNKYDNTLCPVVGGRGASAGADWAAGKPLQLLDMRGRSPAGVDTTASPAGRLTAASIVLGAVDKPGSSGGLESHPVGLPNLPAVNLSLTQVHLYKGSSVIPANIVDTIVTDINLPTGSGNAGNQTAHIDYVRDTASFTTATSCDIDGVLPLGGSGVNLPTHDPFMLGTFFQRL